MNSSELYKSFGYGYQNFTDASLPQFVNNMANQGRPPLELIASNISYYGLLEFIPENMAFFDIYDYSIGA
jgi:hypothetical protein